MVCDDVWMICFPGSFKGSIPGECPPVYYHQLGERIRILGSRPVCGYLHRRQRLPLGHQVPAVFWNKHNSLEVEIYTECPRKLSSVTKLRNIMFTGHGFTRTYYYIVGIMGSWQSLQTFISKKSVFNIDLCMYMYVVVSAFDIDDFFPQALCKMHLL